MHGLVLDTSLLSLAFRRRRPEEDVGEALPRKQGVLTSATDCLIAAQTIAQGARLFTTDGDFQALAPVCGLTLFPASS